LRKDPSHSSSCFVRFYSARSTVEPIVRLVARPYQPRYQVRFGLNVQVPCLALECMRDDGHVLVAEPLIGELLPFSSKPGENCKPCRIGLF
jgi:hypothetical protein